MRRPQCGQRIDWRYFNPRIPCGMRLWVLWVFSNILPISIHASHAGCDDYRRIFRLDNANFNPRIPCGMRLYRQQGEQKQMLYFNPRIPCGMRPIQQICEQLRIDISIHASHAGCDEKLTIKATKYRKFQSTHPMRDATLKLNKQDTRYVDFNPRIPCGMRPALQVGMR